MIKVACRAPRVVLKHPRRQGCRDIVVMTKQGHPVDVLLVKTTTSVKGVLPKWLALEKRFARISTSRRLHPSYKS